MMNTRFHRTLLLCGAAIATLAVPGNAVAQTAGDGASASSASTDADNFGEIIVTARKRNERLMDVPVAVTAISQEQIQRYALGDLASIAQQTPQLMVGEVQSAAGGTINLRGIGAGTSNPSTDQSVSINIDGIQVSQANVLRLGEFDLDRIEILKGPQALFFGKNSPGGIISLVSKEPGQRFEADLRAGYETEAKQRFVDVGVSVPLGGGLAARGFAHIAKQDGWFRNIAVPTARTPGAASKTGPRGTEKVLKGTLVYDSPDSSLKVKLKTLYGDVDRDRTSISANTQQFACPLGVPQQGGGITTDCTLDRFYTSPAANAAQAARDPSFGDGVPYFQLSQWLTALSADYDLTDQLTLSSVTGYYKLKESYFDTFLGTNLPNILASARLRTRQFTQELRLASNWEGPFNFLAGGFYQKSNFKFQNVLLVDIPNVVSAVSPIPNYDQDTRAYSFFAQGRYKVSDQIELSAGGRLSRERKELAGTINRTPFTILRPSRNFKDFSPEFTATYKPTTDLTVYASYREGFTSGGYNTTIQALRSPATPAAPITDPSFDQTTVRGAESGFKGYLADRQIRFDLTGYYYKYKGLQLTSFNPATLAFTTANVGGAKVRGLELNVVTRPQTIEGLELRGGVAYNRANYSNYIGSCYTGQTVAQGCNLNPRNPASPGTAGTAANPFNSQNQKGQQLVRAPKWSFNSGFSYDHEVGSGLGAGFSVDGSYISSYASDIEGDPRIRQAGYWIVNANLSLYRDEDRAWQVSLIGRNLTNHLAVTNSSASPSSGSGTGTATGLRSDKVGTLISPRAIVLQLTLRKR